MRLGTDSDIASLNPHLVTSFTLNELSEMTMAYLVRYGRDNRPFPELATVVPSKANGGISRDGRTITWHLRRGVKWSDGAPFDGDDVVFSTNAVNNPKNNEVGRDGWQLIEKIDEPDKYTVVFHLRHPYGAFLPTFFGSAGANPCVLPKHILGALPDFNNAPYNSKPIGIGPFRYASWTRGDRVELEPNPTYWRGTPKLQRIIYKFIPDRNTLLTQMQTGEIDMWAIAGVGYIRRLQALPNAVTLAQPGYFYAHIDFNTTHPALADVAVRRALRMATNRDQIKRVINFGSGVVSESQITPVSPLFAPLPLVKYDPVAANALLDATGWVRGADGIRAKNGVSLNLTWAAQIGAPDADRLIELVRSEWKALGVAITVRRYASALFFGPPATGIVYGTKWDVTWFAWQQTPDGDLSNTNSCAQLPPNGQNITRLCDPALEKLLAAQSAAYDESERRPLVTKAMARASELVPYYVLYVRDNIIAYNNDLTGFHPNSTTPFDDMLNVDI